jgi:uncharacterized protein (TIGR03000 family)
MITKTTLALMIIMGICSVTLGAGTTIYVFDGNKQTPAKEAAIWVLSNNNENEIQDKIHEVPTIDGKAQIDDLGKGHLKVEIIAIIGKGFQEKRDRKYISYNKGWPNKIEMVVTKKQTTQICHPCYFVNSIYSCGSILQCAPIFTCNYYPSCCIPSCCYPPPFSCPSYWCINTPYSSMHDVIPTTDNTTSTAKIKISVPQDAIVFINGKPTMKTGLHREYLSKGLKYGQNYKYVMRAQITRDGKIIEDTKEIILHANDNKNLAFDFSGRENMQLAAARK